jgi:hypothetical protein
MGTSHTSQLHDQISFAAIRHGCRAREKAIVDDRIEFRDRFRTATWIIYKPSSWASCKA